MSLYGDIDMKITKDGLINANVSIEIITVNSRLKTNSVLRFVEKIFLWYSTGS